MNILEILRVAPVIPVLTISRLEQAAPLARALVRGGLPVLEVTLRTACALEAIAAMRTAVPEAIVGAGTLTRAQDFAAAAAAGAQFGVTPGLTTELVAASRETGFALLPGVMTPTELIGARAAGFQACKLFPAHQAGGLGMLRALAGPFPDQLFCPTGGVTARNASQFLALPNVPCVGGSWVASAFALQAGDWEHIEQLARQAAALRTAAPRAE
ncbi:MAG TPA: bifunctional 4-hydroxy-2-oxoglutarate aldolase/2-dehydro-3-deoxy-phosphogluconate aldolase [Steroidobacteraceae bacterium]|jgi:2-dehydro-3-deoxyphosphogluconate aldolase/(4S)-4-hydroxy-2-oxoglutarate aldolase|nr:bifunctional 4-hydroxy-2-oxoglutarate aldolase/2-dehydro-3-deoxy-phosphogluconate aldolase [Steroidobacteraceae bacterium]